MGYSLKSLLFYKENAELFYNKDIITLGTLYPYLSNKEWLKFRKIFECNATVENNNFSQYFFCDLLGARSCKALDVSDYQGAEIICNLNQKEHNKEISCDVIIDVGTLEHLSDPALALMNIFSFLRLDGYFFFGQPCNGWVNHGFYQFSPTYYQDFTIGNDMYLDLKHIELQAGSFVLPEKYLRNDICLNSFVSSFRKVTVFGLISKKCEGELNFDYMQQKYKIWHNKSSAVVSTRVNFTIWIKHFILSLLYSNYLHWRLKKVLLRIAGIW